MGESSIPFLGAFNSHLVLGSGAGGVTVSCTVLSGSVIVEGGLNADLTTSTSISSSSIFSLLDVLSLDVGDVAAVGSGTGSGGIPTMCCGNGSVLFLRKLGWKLGSPPTFPIGVGKICGSVEVTARLTFGAGRTGWFWTGTFEVDRK